MKREYQSQSGLTDNDAEGLRVGVIASSWHADIIENLVSGARDRFQAGGGTTAHFEIIQVPGSFELPIVADRCARTRRHDALVTIGVIIRGETPHFDFVARAATDGISRVSLEHGIPIGFGLLTVENIDQARSRSESNPDANKGWEAMDAAIKTVRVLRNFSLADRESH